MPDLRRKEQKTAEEKKIRVKRRRKKERRGESEQEPTTFFFLLQCINLYVYKNKKWGKGRNCPGFGKRREGRGRGKCKFRILY